MSQESLSAILGFDYFSYIGMSTFIISALVAIEMYILKKKGNSFHFEDALSSIACGIVSTALIFLIFPLQPLTHFIHDKVAFFDMSRLSNWQMLVAGIFPIFAVDHSYYWGHRFCHVWNIGWVAHAAHHQSERMTFTTSLRNASFQPYFLFFFQVICVIIGFPVAWFISNISMIVAFQFWLHTETVRKMPAWFEWLFNTPSHHRVPHASDAIYLDKNFGGIFVIWDRLYGTFESETVNAHYGTVQKIESWNPVWVQFEHLAKTFRFAVASRSLRTFASIWFQAPAALEGNDSPYLAAPPLSPRAGHSSTRGRIESIAYLILAIVLMSAAAVAESIPIRIGLFALFIVSLVQVGRSLDRSMLGAEA